MIDDEPLGSETEVGRHRGATFTPEEVRGMWVRTITLILIVLFSGVIVMGILSPSGRMVFIMLPLFIAAFLLYLASMFRVVLRGTRVDALSDSVSYFAPCLCIALIILWMPSTMQLKVDMLAPQVLLIGLLIAAGEASRPTSSRTWILVRFFIILSVGLIAITVLSLLPYPHSEPWVPYLIGSVLPGLISLLGTLNNAISPVPRTLGRIFQKNLNVVYVSVSGLALLIYAYTLRPWVEAEIPEQLPLLEWMIATVILLMIAVWFLRLLRASSSTRTAGSWGRKSGWLMSGEGDMELATRAIEAFLDQGRKEELLVVITSALLANGLSESKVAGIIGELVGYREEEVRLTSKRTYGGIVATRRRQRLLIVERTLDKALKELAPTPTREEGEALRSSEGGN